MTGLSWADLSPPLAAGVRARLRPADVLVRGKFGLYRMAFRSNEADGWRKAHLTDGERTYSNDGTLAIEGTDRCMAVVAGMVRAGLKVEVNGVDMAGFKESP